jgi:hypothetical protein
MLSGSVFTLLLFPELRVFEKDIKGRGYGDDESGQSVKEALFPYIAFKKFSRRPEQEREETEFFPLPLPLTGSDRGKGINRSQLVGKVAVYIVQDLGLQCSGFAFYN